MEDSDLIALGALFITTLGWIVSFFGQLAVIQQQRQTQLKIIDLQQQAELNKEARSYDVQSKLATLGRIADCLDHGVELIGSLIEAGYEPSNNAEEKEKRTLSIETAYRQFSAWSRQGVALSMICRHFDPEFTGDFRIGSMNINSAAVKDLPRALIYFISTISLLATEISETDSADGVQQITLSSVGNAHDSAVKHLERVRLSILRNLGKYK